MTTAVPGRRSATSIARPATGPGAQAPVPSSAAVPGAAEPRAAAWPAPVRHRISGARRPGRLAGLVSSVITFAPTSCGSLAALVNALVNTVGSGPER
ncbi:hypothetical protein GCM10009527_057810 [Actinomadura nitritigenes]